MNAQSATYKRVSRLARKNILPVWKKVVLLQRSNILYGIETVGESCRLFLYPFNANNQVMGLGCAAAVMPARISGLVLNNTYQALFCKLFKTKPQMSNNKMTAGETAVMGASYNERKSYMQKCLAKSSTAILVCFDENLEIKTYGIADRGEESLLLTMLDEAANRAKEIAEGIML